MSDAKRGEGPFILEDSDGCSALSIPYRWITKLIFGKEITLSFLEHCIEHDESYWYGGTAEQRATADFRLFQGVAKQGDGRNICIKGAYCALASVMWVIPRIVGSPWLPTPFRWSRGEEYTAGLQYSTELVIKDNTVISREDANRVMEILNDPSRIAATIKEAIVEYVMEEVMEEAIAINESM